MTFIYNKRSLRKRRKQLRNNMPIAEILLWAYLKNKNLKGYKFRRQYSIGNYVVDFYCVKIKLAIEIDGDSHFTEEVITYDKNRQEEIESLGIKVVRFTNKEIYDDIDSIIKIISGYLP